MPLENILKKNITYALPSSTVREVSEIMSTDNVGSVVVVKRGAPMGIITDRDIVLRCVSKGLDPDATPAEQIMTRGVETATLEDGIYDIARKMKLAQVRRIVVIDSSGNTVGLLSFDDIFDLLSSELNDLREAVAPMIPKIMEQAA